MHQEPVGRNVLSLFCGLMLVVVLLGACSRKPVVSQVEIARITAEQVKERLDKGETIAFVDARSEAAWDLAVARIPDAVRVPPHDIENHISEVPRGMPVVVYCT